MTQSSNQLSGQIHTAIQAQQIHGEIHLHDRWARAANPLQESLDQLADALEKQWSDEQKVRQASIPWPLPVRFDVPEYADSVMASWPEIRRQADGEPLRLEGAYAEFAKIFNQPDSPRRFVVLGRAGAGKSLFILKLTVDLLEDEQTRQVPVLLSVGSWNPTGYTSLNEWVARRLAEDYPPLKKTARTSRFKKDEKPSTIAQELVRNGYIIPVLDGLDEMAEENRVGALRLLSDAARNDQPFVVTCRTEEYLRLITESPDSGPLARTPIIELKPLTVHDVHKFLGVESRKPERWDNLMRQAKDEPTGPVATAFSTPFAVWLASMAYRSLDKNPDDLLHLPDAAAIESHLLDELIPAAYAAKIGPPDNPTYPRRCAAQTAKYRSALTFLARHLHGDTADDQTDLAWWRLYQTVTGRIFTMVTAVLIGVPCGIAFALGSRFSSPWADLGGAVAFGVILGTLGGRAARNDVRPRLIGVTLTWRLAGAALLSGCTVGPIFGLICAVGFGGSNGLLNGLMVGSVIGVTGFFLLFWVSGWESGIEFAVSVFLTFGAAAFLSSGSTASGLTVGLVVGVPAGLNAVFTASVYRKAETTRAISPTTLFQGARVSVLGVLPMSGITVGAAYALAVDLPAGIAAGAATVLGLLFSSTAWGIFIVTRLILAISHQVPLRLMGFLREAHVRGILRQVGGMYQFRHSRLAEHLRAAERQGRPSPGTGAE